jgi:hypothetical protein
VAKTIDDAVNLFATGKSSRECEKLTGIPKSTVDREAKKRGVVKGSVGHLIADKVKVEAEIGTLPGTLRTLVNDEVDKKLKMLEFFDNSTLKNCSIMMKKVNADTDFYAHNSVQNTLNKGKENVFGKMPDVQVNNSNTNTQQIGGITRTYVDAPGYKDKDSKDIQTIS